jgi:hypothetical protein
MILSRSPAENLEGDRVVAEGEPRASASPYVLTLDGPYHNFFGSGGEIKKHLLRFIENTQDADTTPFGDHSVGAHSERRTPLTSTIAFSCYIHTTLSSILDWDTILVIDVTPCRGAFPQHGV